MANLSWTASGVLAGTNAQTEWGTAGDTVAAGNCVYKDTADGNSIKACDADAAASAVCCGIALNSAADGQPVEYQTSGYITGNGMTIGVPYFCSTTAGGLMLLADLVAGDYVTFVGVAVTATSLKMGICVSGVVVQ